MSLKNKICKSFLSIIVSLSLFCDLCGCVNQSQKTNESVKIADTADTDSNMQNIADDKVEDTVKNSAEEGAGGSVEDNVENTIDDTIGDSIEGTSKTEDNLNSSQNKNPDDDISLNKKLELSYEAIDDLVNSDIEKGFTSAQIAVIKDGRLIFRKSYGYVNSYDENGKRIEKGIPVTNDTLYDLASNTKMYSVNYALQYLVTYNNLNLDTRISDILGNEFYENIIDVTYEGYENPGIDTNKEWKKNLTIRDVLSHQAGFPADPRYFTQKFNFSTQKSDSEAENPLYVGSDGSDATRKATLEAICKTPLMYEPGTKTLYSDVDYMLLCFVIEKITGQRLDAFLEEHIYGPMNLKHITYKPLENGFSPDEIAATELFGNTRDNYAYFPGIRKYLLQGEVHDEKAYYLMGGVSGHAGLFANATDLAYLANVMIDGTYDGKTYFSKSVIREFTSPVSGSNTSWGLGWWRQGNMARAGYFSSYASEGTFGHQGWTGTLTLIDPKEKLVIVVLTNKINTRVTDPTVDANMFDGKWYETSMLGFAAKFIYPALKCNTVGETKEAIIDTLETMKNDRKKKLSSLGDVSSKHPAAKAYHSVNKVYNKWLREK